MTDSKPEWTLRMHESGLNIERTAFEANWRARQRLDDVQWARIASALPGRIGIRAHNGGTARRFVEAVLWLANSRGYWSDIPVEYGGWHAIYIRFGRWTHENIWSAVIGALKDSPDTQAQLARMVEKHLANYRMQRLLRDRHR